jgi:glycosyltransferase involved in cell wall biosynthesis
MVRVISVVIPLYNKALYIERAIQSVLTQTVPPQEIIVVDDGSTDGGGEIVASFQNPRIRFIRQKNQGVSAARNRGIQDARGDLIAFLDADDAWKPRFLEAIIGLSKEFPQAGLYATAYEIISPYGITHYPEFKILPADVKQGLINYFKAARLYPINSSTAVIPKKVLKEIGGFQEGETWTEDLDVWLRIALRYPVAWSSEYLSSYCQNVPYRSIHSNWIPGEPVASRTAREAMRVGLFPPEDLGHLKEYAARIQLDAARRCLVFGDKDKAVELLGYSSGTKEYAFEWKRLRIMAVLPGNMELWILKLRLGLKEAFPGLARWKHKHELSKHRKKDFQ